MIKKVLILFLLFIFVFFLRLIFSQIYYMNQCSSLSGLEKIKNCEKVILFHFPLSPYTKDAVTLIKNTCPTLKEDKEKLYCYESLRSSLIQVKSFYQPYENILKEINPEIARLRAIESIKWKFNQYSNDDFDILFRDHLSILQYKNSPSVFWSLIVVFSLLGWIGTVIFAILNGFGEKIRKKFLLYCTALFFLFFTLWLLGLWKA